MSRIILNEDGEDTLFRIFESLSGAQRRVMRIMARRHFNDYALDELRGQIEGAISEVEALRTESQTL